MRSDRQLPELELARFARELRRVAPGPLPPGAEEALFAHYRELRLWNPKLSLIGPGTVSEVLDRHYGEALLALPHADPGWRHHVDVGSGGGFPGIVLSATLPDIQTTLVEARQRKWAFLQTVARKASLPCQCLNARVDAPLPHGLPDQIDLLTARAVKLPKATLDALSKRFSPHARAWLWAGRDELDLPADWVLEAQWKLSGSENRWLLSYLKTSND